MDGVRIQPICEIVSDPSLVVENALDVLEAGGRRATGWMQRLRSKDHQVRRAETRSVSGVRTWDGRVCCAEHLRRFEGRGDLAMPFETTCPTCQRVYRIRLDIVANQR